MWLASSSTKRLKVVALSVEDKDMFMGSLLYRTGLDLATIEKLEKEDRTRYQDITTFMRSNNLEPTFRTPAYSCTFSEDTSIIDVVICLVSVTEPNMTRIVELSDMAEALAAGTKIIVVVERMENVDWDPQPFSNLVVGLKKTFEERGANAQRFRFIPVSSASGDNLLYMSRKSLWYFDKAVTLEEQKVPCTVVEAIDDSRSDKDRLKLSLL